MLPAAHTEVRVLAFSGQHYPVHPLDLFRFGALPGDETEGTIYICSATYQATTLDPVHFPIDYLLGDAFLRSVYVSYVFPCLYF